ncbi:MAG TPA: hypothetical protein VFA37_07880 [Gaiellaceae bacterium]|nr:hypothetical protein [Gaiellaceae bacterium]
MKGPRFTRILLTTLAVGVGVVLGAVVGQPGNGVASTATAPKNTALPTISGLAEVGQTLTATVGSWSNKPTSFHYAWSLCDSTGAACLAIGGATAKIFTVTASDVGHTLRVSVTARNSSGADTVTSAVTPAIPPSGCPQGTGTIQIADLAPPADLVIDGAKAVTRLTRSSKQLELHFEITACGGRAVQGATVYASAIPYDQFAGEQGTTAVDGSVTLTEPRRPNFPAGTHQRLLAVFVRATAPGQPGLGGISARRLIAIPIF